MSLRLTSDDAELRSRFLRLKTRQDVARLLEVNDGALTYHLFRSSEAQRYTRFEIPKRRGGARVILAPSSAIKILQQKLNQVLQAVYDPKASAHGFVRDRSIRSNAAHHVRREWVFNADLLDFFPNINFGRVRAMFMAKPYSISEKAATVLAQLCCHDNQLPQGAPTSPIVSNMICAPLDSRLRQLAARHRCYYTRYADDITFSTFSRHFPEEIGVIEGGTAKLGKDLATAVAARGFVVNPNKVRLQHRTGRQEVTGLVVNERLNVDRRLIRQVRAMLHSWKKHGYSAAEIEFVARWDVSRYREPTSPRPSFRNVVRGKLEFIASIRGLADSTYVNLVRKARRLDPAYNQTLVTYEDAVWIIHDENQTAQGTGFFLDDIGMVTCAHVLIDEMPTVRPSVAGAKSFRGVVKRWSKEHDLAIIVSAISPLHSLKLGKSSTVGTGDELTILGYPQWSEDQTLQVTRTRVTGRRPVQGVDRIAVSTPIIPGNSGGPALNSHGHVIGVAARGSWDHNPENESAIIPIECFLQLLDAPLGAEEDPDLFRHGVGPRVPSMVPRS